MRNILAACAIAGIGVVGWGDVGIGIGLRLQRTRFSEP